MQRYNVTPEEQSWLDELRRRRRQRLWGVYLCAAFVALMLAGYFNSIRLVHGKGFTPVTGTIVALGTGSSGEPTFTAEVRLPDGSVHHDTEETSYHHARGEPRVGEGIDYIYRPSPYDSRDVQVWVRADFILKWMFGPAAAIMGLFGSGALIRILRQHSQRRALVRGGERVLVELPQVGHRSITLPAGAGNIVRVDTWRLEGRVFDPDAGEYVEVASDWQQLPAPESFDAASVPPLLVDRAKRSRRWLPVGALWRPPLKK
jgi:hypothetical protein